MDGSYIVRYESEPILEDVLAVRAEDEEEVEAERDLVLQLRSRPSMLAVQRLDFVSVDDGLRCHVQANFCILGKTPLGDG